MRSRIWSRAVRMMTGRLSPDSAQGSQQIETAAVGQMQIEQDQSVFDAAQRRLRIIEALHPIDGMTRAFEMRRYGLAEHRLVLDQQDAHGTFDTAAIEHCAPILTET